MKPSLYTSAMEGNVAELRQHKDVLDGEVTPNNNTVLHVAAQFGQVNYVKVVLEACPSLLCRTNFKGETPLHMAATDGQAQIVEALILCAKELERRELESGWGGAVKEMLRATNVDGDTALHLAARNCHLELEAKYLKVVESLKKGLKYWEVVDRVKAEDIMTLMTDSESEVNREEVEEIIRAEEVEGIMKATEVDKEDAEWMVRNEEVEEIRRATNVDKDPALHMAARNRLEKENRDSYLEVVKLLSKEDAEFQHPPNNFQETPLYLAAERGIMGVAIVDMLLETHKSLLAYSGPGGRTALHAAALKDSTGQSIKKLLEWKKDLINHADEYGWIPLHYAACNGHVSGMIELLSYNPDCWEMVNSKGQNVLHIAVDMNRKLVIDFILDQSWVGQLINQKDNEGNTPLHLLIASDCDGGYRGRLWTHQRADHHAFNGKNKSPVDLVWSNLLEERMSTFSATYIMDHTFLESAGIGGGRNLACNSHVNYLAKLEKARTHEEQKRQMRKDAEIQRKKEVEDKEKHDAFELSVNLFQTIVIVAALIATITFAAAFTIPGGYDGNQGRDQGMAILSRAAAFKAFVVTNTIAMVCSVTSIFLCLSAMGYSLLSEGEADVHYNRRYVGAVGFSIVSMFFLMIAFIAATFAVLAHAIALAVCTCIIACFTCIGFVDLGKFIARLYVLAQEKRNSLY